jgi:hypothetical protein
VITDVPDEIRQLLERCGADDPIDRIEAFEELFSRTLHQGTPSLYAPAIFSLMLDSIADEHSGWDGILHGLYGCVLDLARGPIREPAINSLRIAGLEAILRRSDVFEAVMKRPCVVSDGACEIHYLAGELLKMASPARTGWLTHELITMITKRPSTHMDLWTVLDRSSSLDSLSAMIFGCARSRTQINRFDAPPIFN